MLQRPPKFVANCSRAKICRPIKLKLCTLHYWYLDLPTKFHVFAATRMFAATCLPQFFKFSKFHKCSNLKTLANYMKLLIFAAYSDNELWTFDKKCIAKVSMILYLKVSTKTLLSS